MSGTPWTSEERAYLIDAYPDTPTQIVAGHLGRTLRQIYTQAASLGIKKSPEYLISEHACRLRRGDNVGAEFRFKPGGKAWNKGQPFDSGGRSHETRFKPGVVQGRAAEIAKPVGHERTSKDGYLERKTNNAMPFQKRWRAVHIIEWEKVNGPLPPGHLLVFKDGNKRNFELANLELLTRAENMRRNSYHNYPPEIAQTIQLRGALNRKINNVEKQNNR